MEIKKLVAVTADDQSDAFILAQNNFIYAAA